MRSKHSLLIRTATKGKGYCGSFNSYKWSQIISKKKKKKKKLRQLARWYVGPTLPWLTSLKFNRTQFSFLVIVRSPKRYCCWGCFDYRKLRLRNNQPSHKTKFMSSVCCVVAPRTVAFRPPWKRPVQSTGTANDSFDGSRVVTRKPDLKWMPDPGDNGGWEGSLSEEEGIKDLSLSHERERSWLGGKMRGLCHQIMAWRI